MQTLSNAVRGFIFALCAGVLCAQTPVSKAPERPEQPIELNPLLVTSTEEDSSYDETGIGTMEMDMGDAPFSNDLIGGNGSADELAGVVDVELAQINNPTPTDLSASNSRVDVRGFPSPRLRNGFTQMGISEILNIERSEQIIGPLTPVAGRAAPGGINNHLTGRPRAKPGGVFTFGLGSDETHRLAFDTSRVVSKKRAWNRVSGVWNQRRGPELYSYYRQRTLGASFTWKVSRSSSWLLQFDYADYRSNPSGGIPEHRASRSGKVLGPYLPLAAFHTNGPESLQTKSVGSIALQYEGQWLRWLSLRTTGQLFLRRFAEDRFTRGEYLLDEKIFSGTREPQHTEQPFRALSGQVEATARFRALRGEHKLMLSLEGSKVRAERLQRALNSADRLLLLPESVRFFDPSAPDYSRPAYSPELYRRVITDRTENTLFTALVLSERAAFAKGRLVATAGLRRDWVSLRIEDHRATTATPQVEDNTGKLSSHLGANWVVRPGRLLLFANTSTAFEPSLRVDARTGRIQGNETTLGYEGGATGLFRDKTLAWTLTLFSYYNRNIARKNPLYGSPLYDADQTQPQLVAAGEERFRGGALELRWRPLPVFTVSARHASTAAITTASPDLPEEVGRQLSRLPRDSSTFSLRYAPPLGKLGRAVSLGATFTYIGPYVAWYESATRAELRYPGYSLVGANAGWRLKKGTRTHALNLGLRNLLNANLLARLARTNAGRELTGSYSLSY